MSLFALLFALLIEQVRPLGPGNAIHAGLRAWVRWTQRNLDAGSRQVAWTAWAVAVLSPALVALLIHGLLQWLVGWPLALLWDTAVLYATLGFRQFSHHFTDIRDALQAGDEALARQRLADWQQVDASEVPRNEIVRHVIEYSVLAAHRHVFGVLVCYAIGQALELGACGAVLYRMAEFVPRYWRLRARHPQPVSAPLRDAAARAWRAIDWLPARCTALGFAVVGSFEDAVDSWRRYAQRFPDDNDGVVLAATSGAINVRLGGEALRPRAATASDAAAVDDEPLDVEPTAGVEPEFAHLQSIVGLVWRNVVLWMVLIALLTLAHLLG